MRFGHILKMRLRSLFGRTRVEDEVRRELEVHLEQLIRDKTAEGMSAADARASALRDLGNLGQWQEQSRDVRRVRYLHDFADDLAFALRLLRKSPAFTAVAVLLSGSESAGIQRFLR